MIEFKSVRKVYDDFVALENINLQINEGEILTLIGPSGCGKTTTMRMINRLTEPTEGQILIDNENISELDPVDLRRRIGYIIQEIGLFPHMTIEENVSLVLRLKKEDKKKYSKRVDELLELVGLDPQTYKHRTPSELSGGQQQRIGVIRALAADPDIILMDEPFSALDPISRERLQDDIKHLQKKIKKTIVFVTHDMDEAIKIADRIAIMNEGEIVQIDTPENIIRNPKNDFVKGFIGQDRLDQNQTMPLAIDLMLSRTITSSPDRHLAEAMYMMRKKGVTSLMITDDSEDFLGIVSFESVNENYANEKLIVFDIMETENLKTLSVSDSLTKAADFFQDSNISAIPVLKENKLIGIVTRSSMIKGIAELKKIKE